MLGLTRDAIKNMFPRGTRVEMSAPPMAEYYVAQNGNDTNNGSLAYPFKTITRAQQAARANTTAMTGDVIIYLRNGTYRISSTLTFNSSDGGNGLYDVIYKAYPGETPVIDGGISIPAASWQIHDSTKNIWRVQPGVADFRQLYVKTSSGKNHNTPEPNAADVPEYPYAGYPTSLSVMTSSYDGTGKWERRAIRARAIVPSNTFSRTGEGYDYLVSSGFWSDLREWPLSSLNSQSRLGDAQYYVQDIEFVYQSSWRLPRIHLYAAGEYDGRNQIIMQQPAFFLVSENYVTQLGKDGSGQPDWIENAYALLDEPGEWYYDHHIGWLFYIPLDNEPLPNSTNIEFSVPVVEKLVDIAGVAGNPVQNLRFEGITFKHASYLRPNVYGVGHIDSQANLFFVFSSGSWYSERDPGSVLVTYGNNIQFERCTFTKLGSAGLDLSTGTQNSTVQGCVFDDLSGTGMNIGEPSAYDPGWVPIPDDDVRVTKNNSVLNCYFTNICIEFKGGHAIYNVYTQDSRIEHNEISGTAYSAISVGWGHSYTRTFMHNNSVQYNHITNYMMEMKDGAAIYTLSLQNGTRVQHNWIHDGGGSGLYPDEQTAQTYWRYNVVYRSGNSLQDHSLGPQPWTDSSIRENIIEDNYFDMDPIIEPRRQVTHISNNIWRIGVGDNVSATPNATVMANVVGAGLEAEYQNITMGSNPIRYKDGPGLYWSDMSTEQTPVKDNLVLFWTGIAGIAVVAVAGVVIVVRKQEPRNVPAAQKLKQGGTEQHEH
nr:right-handed parallel beta-helix repeat-containing protein [Candidatus Sigynarchaeota archaeon]